jgi:putative spermidine/putrescine transport system permease protein
VILRITAGLVYAFILIPMVIVVLAAFNAGNYFTFPPQGFSLKWFANFFNRREFMQALRVSTEIAFWTAVASTIIGTAAAVVLVRSRFRGRDFLNAFVTSPLLLPQILTGVALLQFYTLLHMHASYAALLIGHIVVTTPYVIRTVTATLTHFDIALEEAAQSLGAHPVRAFFEVTLGVIKPGVVAGAIFAFAISFDTCTRSRRCPSSSSPTSSTRSIPRPPRSRRSRSVSRSSWWSGSQSSWAWKSSRAFEGLPLCIRLGDHARTADLPLRAALSP